MLLHSFILICPVILSQYRTWELNSLHCCISTRVKSPNCIVSILLNSTFLFHAALVNCILPVTTHAVTLATQGGFWTWYVQMMWPVWKVGRPCGRCGRVPLCQQYDAGSNTDFLPTLWSQISVRVACVLIEVQIQGRWDGGTCSVYGGEEKCIQGFGEETWREENIWKT